MRLDRAVRERLQISWNEARRKIETGKIRIDGKVVTDPALDVDGPETLDYQPDAPRPKKPLDLERSAIVHLDPHVVVVEKSSGLLTVPFEGHEKDTLDQQLRRLLSKISPVTGSRRSAMPPLMVLHRLDRGTSGLLVFARTFAAKEHLAKQFRAHSAHRRYLALVHGDMASQTFRSHLVIDRGDGIRGSSEHAKGRGERRGGKEAITHVEAVEHLRGATLLSCRLETGRTNQIRIHLAEAGHPLIGETIYLRDFEKTPIVAPRLMLHAAELGFVHPQSGDTMMFTSPLPDAFETMVASLRQGQRP